MRALQLSFPALGKQHHPGHPAREMEEGETHQAVQPKTTAEQDEFGPSGQSQRPHSGGGQLDLESGMESFTLVQRKHHRA